jgi:nucleotide-binding universal stress UspA family protein
MDNLKLAGDPTRNDRSQKMIDRRRAPDQMARPFECRGGSAVGAEVSFLTVTEPFHVFTFNADQIEDTRPEFKRHMEARAEHTLAAAGEVAAAAGISFDTIQREGEQPYEIIIDIAEARRCDLIVMASHGRRGVSAMLLGSETMKVLTHTTRPVLVVR